MCFIDQLSTTSAFRLTVLVILLLGEAVKRENKNRPREMPSKKTVKRYRDVVGLKTEQKTNKRDPRFDNLCGEFDEKVCKMIIVRPGWIVGDILTNLRPPYAIIPLIF